MIAVASERATIDQSERVTIERKNEERRESLVVIEKDEKQSQKSRDSAQNVIA